MLKRTLSFLLAFCMLIGGLIIPSNVQAKKEDVRRVNYNVQKINGKSYKVYKFTDVFGGKKDRRIHKIRNSKINNVTTMGMINFDELKDAIPNKHIEVVWTTYDLKPGNPPEGASEEEAKKYINMPIYLQVADFDSDVVIAQTKEITGTGKYQIYKTDGFNDSRISKNPEDWYLLVPDDIKYDIVLNGNRLEGDFEVDNATFTVNQSGVAIYKAEYFTNKSKPSIEVQKTNNDNITTTVEVNDDNLEKNEYYSFGEPVSQSSGEKSYFNGQKIVIKKYGRDSKQKLQVSEPLVASRIKMAMKAPGKTEFDRGGTFTDNGTPYHYEVTGDYLTPHIFTIRQDLKVNFDPNGAEWQNAPAKDQIIGHSMKLGESWAGLGPINAPTASDIKEDTIPKKEENGNKVDQVFVGWSRTKDGTAIQDMKAEVITNDTTFYAVYAPKAQGKIKIEYQDMQGQPIDAKYKLENKDYPTELSGNKGETIKDEHLNGAPEFLGYEFKQVETKPVPEPPASATYEKPAKYTLIYKYNKLDSVIPEIPDPQKPDEKKTKPTGYVTVTFKPGDNGMINDGTDDIKYFVNPKDDIKFGNKKIVEPTVVANENYDVKDPKWEPDFVAKKTETITADATFTAQYEKQKGTVTYKYNEHVNETTVQNPSTVDIPAEPTDNTQYDVGTEVTAETTVAPKDKTIQVKDNNGTIIGKWTFSGWTPAKLTIKKNSETVKNEFTGTWTFSEAGKHDVTYEFQSGTSGVELPEEVKKLLTLTTKKDQYEGTTVTAPTETYDSVEIKTGDNPGTWTFDAWYAKEIKDANKGKALEVTEAGPNKFIGVWTFAKAKSTVSYKFEYEPAGTNADKTDIPKVPTDDTKYEVGKKVTPKEVNLTNVEVKDTQGNVIGIWSFQGWDPEELTVNLDASKNVFTGKWLFAEKLVMSHKYVVEGTTTLPAELKAPKDVYIAKGSNYKPATPAKTIIKNIKDDTDNKFYDYTFKSWNPEKLDKAQDNQEFIGTWTRKQSVSEPPTVVTPKEGDKTIGGDGKPDSKIIVKTPDGKEHDGEVDKDGKWTVDIPEAKDGDKYTVVQIEKGKEKSEEVTVHVRKKGNIEVEYPISEIYVGDYKTVTPEIYGTSTTETDEAPYVVNRRKLEDMGVTVKAHSDGRLTIEIGENYRGPKRFTIDLDVYVDGQEIATYADVIVLEAKTRRPEAAVKTDDREIHEHKAYIFGYPDGSVRPQGNITRAEAAAMIARLLNIEAFGSNTKPMFPDTPSAWYNRAINAVVQRGIMKGYPDGSFKPNDPITRAEFTTMIAAIDNKAYGVAPFADVKGHWAELAIGREYQAGRINGYPDGTFRPQRHITRAEAATILNKIFDRCYDAMSLIGTERKENVRIFTDLFQSFWGYNDMVEATNNHSFKRRVEGRVEEDWVEVK